MYRKVISIGDRRFSIIRVAREDRTSEEAKEAIKESNELIDVVLRDGKGSLLFCQEVKDVQFRDVLIEQTAE